VVACKLPVEKIFQKMRPDDPSCRKLKPGAVPAVGMRIALLDPMAHDTNAKRAAQIVSETLDEQDSCEVERMMVGDAVVVRKGNHYRIESGGDSAEDSGVSCDCGEPLSSGRCRVCGRRY
jgi:hypothetical protein